MNDVVEYYKERAKVNTERFDNLYQATRQTASDTYKHFDEISNRTIREVTAHLRSDDHPHNLIPEMINGEKKSISEARVDKDYVYQNGNYIYRFPHRDSLAVINENVVEEVLFLYCEEDQTKREITSSIPILSERDVQSILSCHEKTHADHPFTVESLDDKSVLELVQDTKRKKELQYQEEMKKETDPFEYFKDKLNVPEIHVEHPQLTVDTEHEESCLLIPVADLHLGVRDVNSEVSVVDQAEIFNELIRSLIGEIPYKPEQIILLINGDLFHIDNVSGTTTRGTDVESCASYKDIIDTGYDMIHQVIGMTGSVADLEVGLLPGNHDRNTSYALATHLDQISDTLGFDFTTSKDRAYFQYKNNVIGSSHHRNESINDLEGIMMREAEHLISEGSNLLFIGADKHWERLNGNYSSGLTFYRPPKIGPIDDYESKYGYYNRPCLKGLRITESGLKNIHSVYVDEVSSQ